MDNFDKIKKKDIWESDDYVKFFEPYFNYLKRSEDDTEKERQDFLINNYDYNQVKQVFENLENYKKQINDKNELDVIDQLLKHKESILFPLENNFFHKYVMDKYLDKTIILYRGVRDFKISDPFSGELGNLTWWTPNLETAKKYSGETKKIFQIKIILNSKDLQRWLVGRENFNESYTYGYNIGEAKNTSEIDKLIYFSLSKSYALENIDDVSLVNL